MDNIKADILVLYGSQTGTAQYVAETISRELEIRLFKTQTSSLDELEIDVLPDY